MIHRVRPLAPPPRLSPDALLALKRQIRNLRQMTLREEERQRAGRFERTLRAAEARLYNALR